MISCSKQATAAELEVEAGKATWVLTVQQRLGSGKEADLACTIWISPFHQVLQSCVIRCIIILEEYDVFQERCNQL